MTFRDAVAFVLGAATLAAGVGLYRVLVAVL